MNIGSRVPDFELKDQDGNLVRFRQLLGSKYIILFFYPKDNTAGCTAQACAFRDEYERFLDLGATVIGISSDDEGSHRDFRRQNRLPFTLLSDPEGEVREMFGVPQNFFGLLPGRTTYIIDPEGTIQHIFNSQLNPRKHVTVALDYLQNISKTLITGSK